MQFFKTIRSTATLTQSKLVPLCRPREKHRLGEPRACNVVWRCRSGALNTTLWRPLWTIQTNAVWRDALWTFYTALQLIHVKDSHKTVSDWVIFISVKLICIYILAINIVIDPTFCGDNPLFSLIRIYIFLEVTSCVNDSKQLRGDECIMYTHLPKHLAGNIFPVTRLRWRQMKKVLSLKTLDYKYRVRLYSATVICYMLMLRRTTQNLGKKKLCFATKFLFKLSKSALHELNCFF